MVQTRHRLLIAASVLVTAGWLTAMPASAGVRVGVRISGHGGGVRYSARYGKSGHHYGRGRYRYGHHSRQYSGHRRYHYGQGRYGYYQRYPRYHRYHGAYRRYPVVYQRYGYDYHHYSPSPRSGAYIVTSPYSRSAPNHVRLVQRNHTHSVYRDSDPLTVQPQGDASKQGWQLLAAGKYDQSLSAFSEAASAAPQQGAAKVGYALASAAAGRLERGVWAMRRAFRVDPDAMGNLQIDGQLAPTLRQLAERYAYVPKDFADEAGAAFMTAALHYLLHDPAEAQAALELAEQLGDHKQSTKQLKQLIGQRQEHKPASDPH